MFGGKIRPQTSTKNLTTKELMNPDLYLHDGVIALRPYHPEDAEPMLAAVHESSDQVSPWLPALSTDMPLVEVTSYIAIQKHLSESGEAYNFVIQDHRTGQILGGIGLTQINRHHRFANLYYWVRSSRTGEGVASRAVRLAARYAFVEAGLARVEIVVSGDVIGASTDSFSGANQP